MPATQKQMQLPVVERDQEYSWKYSQALKAALGHEAKLGQSKPHHLYLFR